MLPTLIIFSPSPTSTPHAQQHLVHPDDRDQLAQLRYYRLPTALSAVATKDHEQVQNGRENQEEELNKVLGLMGLARGLMAFSESFSPGSSKATTATPEQGRTHIITSSKKQTIIFNSPHTEIFLLLIIRDPIWIEEQAKDILQGVWERFTLTFGLDPWLHQSSTTSGEADRWWDRWLTSCMTATTPTDEQMNTKCTSQQQEWKTHGLQQWLSNTQMPCEIDIVIRHVRSRTEQQDSQHSRKMVQGIDSVMKAFPVPDVEQCHRVVVGTLSRSPSTSDDENDKTHKKALIYDTEPSYLPLTTHLLDLLVTYNEHNQCSTFSASERGPGNRGTMKRDRKRSPPPPSSVATEKEREKGWPSWGFGLSRFGFGAGTDGGATRNESEGRGMGSDLSGGGSGMVKGARAGGVISWFGFGSDHSSTSSSNPQTSTATNKVRTEAPVNTNLSAAIRTEPKIVTDMNMESLNEALVTSVEPEFAGGPERDHSAHYLHDGSPPESLDSLEWKAERIWLPLAMDDREGSVASSSATSTDDGESHGRMREATLAYTFTLNKPRTQTAAPSPNAETDIDSHTSKAKEHNEAVENLFHAIEASADMASSPLTPAHIKPPSSLRHSGQTQVPDQGSSSHWVYTSRGAESMLVKSSWKGGEIVFPSASAVAQRVKTKSSQAHVPAGKVKRTVSVDQAGNVTRRSLM
ncbi:hypothetical protein QFC22_000275, partial [Naganishia vaughanmartiniae]